MFYSTNKGNRRTGAALQKDLQPRPTSAQSVVYPNDIARLDFNSGFHSDSKLIKPGSIIDTPVWIAHKNPFLHGPTFSALNLVEAKSCQLIVQSVFSSRLVFPGFLGSLVKVSMLKGAWFDCNQPDCRFFVAK